MLGEAMVHPVRKAGVKPIQTVQPGINSLSTVFFYLALEHRL
jgi:hypothetical protein